MTPIRLLGLLSVCLCCGILHACSLVSVEPEPVDIELSAIPNPMAVGDSVLLTATLRTATGKAIGPALFVWESSIPSVATVDREGWVRVESMGETTIRVTSNGLHASSALVTLGEVAGRVLVDGEPASGLAVRLDLGDGLVAVTNRLGEYRFLDVQPDTRICSDEDFPSGCYFVDVLGENFIGYDMLRYGFQDYDQWASVELGMVTGVEGFSGFSIPECDATNSLVELVFVNNDPVYDDFWRAAVCRWTSIIRDMNQTPCPLGPPTNGILVHVEYVSDGDDTTGEAVICNGHPWRASFKMVRSDVHNSPEYWPVPGNHFHLATGSIGFALGVMMTEAMPSWRGLFRSDSTGAVFTGPEATRAFRTLGGVGHPGVTIGSGQALWWNLCNEVFGRGGRSGNSRPIGPVTVGALIDSGYYEVEANQAEYYRPCWPSASASDRVAISQTITSPPIRVIDRRTVLP